MKQHLALLSCPACQEWQRKVNISQAARDNQSTRQLYLDWGRHILDDHNNHSLNLVRQLWPGANVSEER